MAPFVEFDLAVIIHSTTESVRLYGTPVSIGGKTPNMLTVRSGRQTVSCRGLAVPGARNTHNDMLARQKYGVLKQCIDENAVKNIEYMIIWAEHCAEESQLLWRYSFLLRLVK